MTHAQARTAADRGPRIGIIGAGAAGLSTAMYATQLGARDVMVFDESYPGQGSSGLSAGIFNRQTPKLDDLQMRDYTVRVLEEFERDGDLQLHRVGYVRVAKTDEHLQMFERARALQIELGIPGAIIDQAELRRLVPGLRCDDFVGGLYGSQDGHLDGPMLCAAYQKRARANGAIVRPRTAIIGADDTPAGLELHTSTGETHLFDVVVNAAGPSGSRVARLLGVVQPIVNERHQVCLVRFADTPERRRIPSVQTHVPGSGTGLYIRPEGRGQLLAGLHSQDVRSAGDGEDPHTFAKTIDDDYVADLVEALSYRLDWDDLSLAGGWSGLYPISPDGRFQVGRYRSQPRVIAAGGLGGVGLSTSAAVGRLAAEWAIAGEPSAFDFGAELVPDRPSLLTWQPPRPARHRCT